MIASASRYRTAVPTRSTNRPEGTNGLPSASVKWPARPRELARSLSHTAMPGLPPSGCTSRLNQSTVSSWHLRRGPRNPFAARHLGSDGDSVRRCRGRRGFPQGARVGLRGKDRASNLDRRRGLVSGRISSTTGTCRSSLMPGSRKRAARWTVLPSGASFHSVPETFSTIAGQVASLALQPSHGGRETCWPALAIFRLQLAWIISRNLARMVCVNDLKCSGSLVGLCERKWCLYPAGEIIRIRPSHRRSTAS